MIATTLNSESVWLLPYQPEADQFDCVISKLTERSEGLTMRQGREALGAAVMRKFRFTSKLSAVEAAQLRSSIDSYANKRVVFPFWPCRRLYSLTDTGSHGGMIRIFWYGELSDGAYAIDWNGSTPVTVPTLAPSPGLFTAPAALAKFDGLPEFSDPLPDGSITASFSLVQSGTDAFDLSPAAFTLTNGANVNGLTIPKLTVPIDWMARGVSTKIKISRSNIGYSRDAVDTFYSHQPRKIHKVSGVAIGDEVKQLVKLFIDRQASVKQFWLQSEYSTSQYVFGGFDDDKISLSWRLGAHGAEEVAQFSFSFQTLPAEEVIPSGEVNGTTTGPLAARWWGYRVSNSAQTWRFTSHSADLAGPDGTYLFKPIEHSEITEDINLQTSDVTLKLSAFSGNPFEGMLTDIAGEMLKVEVIEGLVSSPGTAGVIWTGTVSKVSAKGQELTVKVKSASAFLKIQGPRQQLIASCCATFGDARCKYVQTGSTRTLSGTPVAGRYIFSGTDTDHAFAGGWAERTLPSGAKQRYVIQDNVNATGTLSVKLFGSVVPAPTGAETGWKLFKGCARTWDACVAYGNTANFAGAVRVPDTNPSMITANSSRQGGKKG